jgi:hypothetical protein
MVRRFNSDAGQMRAAYLSSLLVALFQACRSWLASLRTATRQELPASLATRRLQHGSPSTWGAL